MHAITRQLRSMPLWLLREYLVELGGQAVSEDCVRGEGWQARLVQLEDFQIGSLRVGQLQFEWQGTDDALKTVWPALEKLLARAGG